MDFDEITEFGRDRKKLLKRYRSLSEDLDYIKKVLSVEPDADPPFSFRIEGLKIKSCIIKVRKISCKSLKNKGVNSGLRLIYAYFSLLFSKSTKFVNFMYSMSTSWMSSLLFHQPLGVKVV